MRTDGGNDEHDQEGVEHRHNRRCKCSYDVLESLDPPEEPDHPAGCAQVIGLCLFDQITSHCISLLPECSHESDDADGHTNGTQSDEVHGDNE